MKRIIEHLPSAVAQQRYQWDAVYEADDGTKIKATIAADSYDAQSKAFTERWDGSKWHRVLSWWGEEGQLKHLPNPYRAEREEKAQGCREWAEKVMLPETWAVIAPPVLVEDMSGVIGHEIMDGLGEALARVTAGDSVDMPLPLDRVQVIVEHLLEDGSRDGLILGDELNVAMGASARRRAARAAEKAAAQEKGPGIPIVPLPPESTIEVAHRERDILGSFADLALYGSEFKNDEHTETWLDWALQVRLWGYSWPDALMIARVWYFG
jgi:hypothetical protein